nr:MerR family transcriptional regulator [Solidesulfovibrio aerotolerans]
MRDGVGTRAGVVLTGLAACFKAFATVRGFLPGSNAVSDSRLYSIAAIAKILDMPESTLHYWKNRFDDVLPSLGAGRSKRFRAEAVAIFREIGGLLGQGLSAGDVRSELARRYPVNVGGDARRVKAASVLAVPQADAVLALAAGIGSEIARSLAEHLVRLGPVGGACAPGLPEATVQELRAELEQAREQGAALANKVGVLESELMRLRKDRRELEAYLVDKINALRRPGPPA